MAQQEIFPAKYEYTGYRNILYMEKDFYSVLGFLIGVNPKVLKMIDKKRKKDNTIILSISKIIKYANVSYVTAQSSLKKMIELGLLIPTEDSKEYKVNFKPNQILIVFQEIKKDKNANG